MSFRCHDCRLAHFHRPTKTVIAKDNNGDIVREINLCNECSKKEIKVEIVIRPTIGRHTKDKPSVEDLRKELNRGII